MSKVRSIVIENQLPRSLELQPYVSKDAEGEIQYNACDESHKGIISLHSKIYEDDFEDVYVLWDKYWSNFKRNNQI